MARVFLKARRDAGSGMAKLRTAFAHQDDLYAAQDPSRVGAALESLHEAQMQVGQSLLSMVPKGMRENI